MEQDEKLFSENKIKLYNLIKLQRNIYINKFNLWLNSQLTYDITCMTIEPFYNLSQKTICTYILYKKINFNTITIDKSVNNNLIHEQYSLKYKKLYEKYKIKYLKLKNNEIKKY